MKKYTLLFSLILLFIGASYSLTAQYAPVQVSVSWSDFSNENRVEIRDPSNNLVAMICNINNCYDNLIVNAGAHTASYDLGCLPVATGYSAVLFDLSNNGWAGTASVTVTSGVTNLLTNAGGSASSGGQSLSFNVPSGAACTDSDKDMDGTPDPYDDDDDNNGTPDQNEINCPTTLTYNYADYFASQADPANTTQDVHSANISTGILVSIGRVDPDNIMCLPFGTLCNGSTIGSRTGVNNSVANNGPHYGITQSSTVDSSTVHTFSFTQSVFNLNFRITDVDRDNDNVPNFIDRLDIAVFLNGVERDLNHENISANSANNYIGKQTTHGLGPATFNTTPGDIIVAVPFAVDSITIQYMNESITESATQSIGFGNFSFCPDFAQIGDLVWEDDNNNGLVDGMEEGVGGVTVNLLDDMGMTIATQVTSDGTMDVDGDGNIDPVGYYNFNEVPVGTYSVEIATPSGFINTYDLDDGTTSPDASSGPIVVGEGTIVDDADFGIDQSDGEIGDIVWLDEDRNGAINGGEVGLAGVTVNLRDDMNNIIATQVTSDGTIDVDGDGNIDPIGYYNFTGLDAGDYTVEMITPTDGIRTYDFDDGTTSPDGSVAVTLAFDEIRTDVDFGVDFEMGSIGDLVWFDDDRDGTVNGAEVGLGGVTVNLLDDMGMTIATQVTSDGTMDVDGDGNIDPVGYYNFTGLAAGDYSVEVVVPTDGLLTYDLDDGISSPDGSVDVTLTQDEMRTDVDFGIDVLMGSIGDIVWFDDDQNGVINGLETGLGGVTVTLRDDMNNIIGTQVTSDGTMDVDGDGNIDPVGYYNFTGLDAGDYNVEITTPTGGTVTYDLDDGTSSPDGSTPVTLTDDQMRVDVDFGVDVPMGSIGDLVWNDDDRDGTLNGAETGQAGVTVVLRDDMNNIIDTQVTGDGTFDVDGDGNIDPVGYYNFTGLEAGNYTVEVTAPTGNIVTYDLDDGTTNPDGSTAVTLTDNQMRVDVDFGLDTSQASIGDIVWEDDNANGAIDGSEAGIAGVTVVLRDDMNNIIDTQVTGDGTFDVDGDGNIDPVGYYNFTNLPAGSYTVEMTTPGGGVVTYDQDDGTSSPDGNATVTVGFDQNRTDVDFGVRFPGGVDAFPDTLCTDLNVVGMIDVLANDVANVGNLDPGSVAIVTGEEPSHGSTSINAGTGVITYTPDTDFIGFDSFSYEVCNDQAVGGTVVLPGTGGAIPDGFSAFTDVINIPSGGVITDVNVDIDITHTAMLDLIISVISPDRTVSLFGQRCGYANDLDKLFDDGGVAWSCPNRTDGLATAPPDGTLANFNGDNSTGNWTLRVQDVYGYDVGTVNSWSLIVTTAGNASCDTTTVYVKVAGENITETVNDDNNTLVNTPVGGDVKTNDFDPEGDNQTFDSFLNQNGSGTQITTGAMVSGFDADGNPVANAGTLAFVDGVYTYTPATDFIGYIDVPYSTCDDGTPVACDTSILHIDVAPLSDPNDPNSNDVIANDDDNVTPLDVNVGGNVLDNDNDPEGDVMMVDEVDIDEDGNFDAPGTPTSVAGVDSEGNPVANAGQLTINADGTYLFDPEPTFTGTISVPYINCDNGTPQACDPAILTIIVLPDNGGNDPPFGGDDFELTTIDVPVVNSVSGNDQDPNSNPTTVTDVNGTPVPQDGSTVTVNTPNGQVEIDDNGDYTYTPNTGYIGPDQFVYTVCDDQVPQMCDQATAYFTIYPSQFDFGDLPPSYGGGGHRISPDANGDGVPENPAAFWLGNIVDGESIDTPSDFADGDDTGLLDDEDGLILPTEVTPGAPATFQVIVNGNTPGTIVHFGLWLDWGGSGGSKLDTFYAGQGTIASPTVVNVDVMVPSTYNGGTINTRLRAFASAPSKSDTLGTVNNGEIEDNQSAIALPLDLISFSGQQQGQDALLKWTSASEFNFDGYELQHSLDGRVFETLSEIEGKGLTGQIASYDFLHEDVARGNNYYRLKMIDKDGSFKLSKIVILNFGKDNYDVKIYPNPGSSDDLNIDLRTLGDDTTVHIKVITADGKLLRSYKTVGNQILEEHGLVPGAYIIDVVSPIFRKSTLVVVSK